MFSAATSLNPFLVFCFIILTACRSNKNIAGLKHVSKKIVPQNVGTSNVKPIPENLLDSFYLFPVDYLMGKRKGLYQMQDLTHFDVQGNAVMVDVSKKESTVRRAVATGQIRMRSECYQVVRQGSSQKGDVLGVARVAGIMAAKRTDTLIPLCHPLLISQASIDFELIDQACSILVTCTVKTSGVTGVEMEALTGVSIALLTIYDMCKSMDKSMELGKICLVEKSGGKSGVYQNKRI